MTQRTAASCGFFLYLFLPPNNKKEFAKELCSFTFLGYSLRLFHITKGPLYAPIYFDNHTMFFPIQKLQANVLECNQPNVQALMHV